MRVLFLIAMVTIMNVPANGWAASKEAVFAGGCFWCMESEFHGVDGVESVISGYSGGSADTANYDAVSRGDTGHREVVQITYDPEKISYEDLLTIFWRNVDPFDPHGQFCDKGFQYTAAIFVHDEGERALAAASVKRIADKAGKDVKTAILPAEPFYAAEDYHQEFFLKNEQRYKIYRNGCGRDKRLDQIKGITRD